MWDLALTAGAGLLGNVLTNRGQQKQAEQQLKLQQETYDWQKEMQKKTWEREDNAIQRRSKDLQRAGLSKTLAAGQGASSSGPIRLQERNAPTDNLQVIGQSLAGLTDVIGKTMNIAQTQADAIRARNDAEVSGALKDYLLTPEKQQYMGQSTPEMTPLHFRELLRTYSTVSNTAIQEIESAYRTQLFEGSEYNPYITQATRDQIQTDLQRLQKEDYDKLPPSVKFIMQFMSSLLGTTFSFIK